QPLEVQPMSGNAESPAAERRPRRFWVRLSLRGSMVAIALLGGFFAATYRRAAITPRNVASLAPVARLDKNDIWRIAWSPKRDRMGIVGWEAPVEIRDAVSLALLETIGDGKKIIHFAFSPDESVVAYAENPTNTATILNRRTGKTI